MTVPGEDWIILKGKYGPAHAFKQAGGHYVLCKRRRATCVACKEYGVPVSDPDPFDVLATLLRENWHKRWVEMDRQPRTGDDGVVDHTDRVHIVARSEDNRDSTVLFGLGDDPRFLVLASAIAAVHNEMVGQPI